MSPLPRAVVFAYHNVGVRCLSVLLAHGVNIPLVVTHRDNPNEHIWFDSVAELAALHDIPVITPDDPNTPEVIEQVRAAQPDFLFSFYYRNMLKKALLEIPSRGAYNMHGSLLPKYRGRVPVNWAIIKGERETGATLHVMNEKPDNGAIVDQQAVPILPDDMAKDVFDKVTVAAEIALWSVLPQLMRGQLPRRPNPLAQGSYFGGRKPEDGRLDWTRPAAELYNLIRAVAPPYPGAFFESGGRRLVVARARLARPEIAALLPESCGLGLHAAAGKLLARAGDGGVIHILELWDAGFPGTPLSPQQVSELAAHLP